MCESVFPHAQVIHVLGSYQVFTMPVFDMLEYLMVYCPLNVCKDILTRLSNMVMDCCCVRCSLQCVEPPKSLYSHVEVQ